MFSSPPLSSVTAPRDPTSLVRFETFSLSLTYPILRFKVTQSAALPLSNTSHPSATPQARQNARPTRSGVLLPSAWIAAERREAERRDAERREAEIRQRESFTTHPRLQVDDDCQITFGDAPLLQSRLPIPLHMIPNADCYVGRGGRLCYGTPSEPDSSDSDSSGQWPFPRIARQV